MTDIAYVCADPGIPVFGSKGASVHIQEIVRAWRRRGATVRLYCTRLGTDRPADLDDLDVIHVPVEAAVPAGMIQDPRVATQFRERAQARAAEVLGGRIVADGADVVYERYSLFSTALAATIAALRVPGVLEVNAPLIDEQRRHRVLVDGATAGRTLDAQLAAASRIAAVSAPVADWLRARRATPADRIVVAPNGVDTARIRPVGRAVDDGGPPVVLFVGTLKPWHGLEVLLDAMSLARTPWRLRIVGDGPLGTELRARSDAAGLDVEFTGAVAPADVPVAMVGATVAVAPYPAGDGHYFSPLKVYEYAAAALPVVASDVPGMAGIVDHGRTGMLVPPADPAALAAAIDALVDDPARAAALGCRGRRDMTERHSWDQVLTRILGSLDAPSPVPVEVAR